MSVLQKYQIPESLLLFLVKKISEILFFGPSFRKPAGKASSGEIYLKKQGFIYYRPVNMIQ